MGVALGLLAVVWRSLALGPWAVVWRSEVVP